jgi:glycosyltransferase involved in cell wall biosynthesis
VTAKLPESIETQAEVSLTASLTVSVVVPTRNRGSLITETLERLLSVDDSASEILVVDQSTDTITADIVHGLHLADARVRLVPTRTVGSSNARNIGYSTASGDVVAFIDDDCMVEKGWLDAVMAEFQDSTVAAVFGRLTPYEQEERNGTEVGLKASPERTVYTSPLPPWWVGHGGNMAFRKADLVQLGGFDPLLSAGGHLHAGEDTDLAHRLLVRGRKIVYAPDAVAYHKHWKDWSAQKKMERSYGIGAGAQFAKYMRVGDPWGLRFFCAWVWQLGVRRIGAGLLKWRSLRVVYLGYCQLVYPWIGLLRSARYAIDRSHTVYLE